MAMRVDLNSDIGESFGAYCLGCDEEVISLVTSVNIACGWHAGDALIMGRTVELAARQGVAVGAHPGYPDQLGFGRREMGVSPKEMKAYVQYQIGAISAFCKASGVPLHHVKPHGAMYNQAARDHSLAIAVCEGIAAVDDQLILVGLAKSELIRAADELGLRRCSEVFADRAYEEDGSLVSRKVKGSVITNVKECAARVIRMVKEGKVTTRTGRDIAIEADTICVHGDNPQAVETIRILRKMLEQEQIEIMSF